MSTFLFAYRAPKNFTPGDPEAPAAWQAFFEDLGSNVIEVGNPIFARTPVGNPAGDTVLGGYSLISADDLESAVAMTRGCPALENGGGVEVGEITPVGPDGVATGIEDQARAAGLAG
jgi:hypothetical protein